MSEVVGKSKQNDQPSSAVSTFDLKNILAEIKAHEAWQKGERSAKTLIQDHRQRIALVALHGGTIVAPHQANGPISIQMIEGKMKFITPLRTVVLEGGQILTIQSKIQHSMEASEDSAFLLTLMLEGNDGPHPAIAKQIIAPQAIEAEKSILQTESKLQNSAGAASAKGRVTLKRTVQEHRRLLPADGKPIESLKQYEAEGGLTAVRRVLGLPQEQIIEEIKRSGLRGRGGAGFPAGIKWASVLSDGRGKRYVCCNGAEGEPGTFKDRYLLRMNPYQTLEGLAIAAYTVGAERAFFCIKRSFRQVTERLRKAIEEFHNANLFPQGHEVKIELVLGPEEYLFGEEKALLEVVEGSLPMPRWLAPYIEGLFRQPLQDNPTLVNNVETLANVTYVLGNGADKFRQVGTMDSPGTMIFTVCGDVERAGCYELPLGTSLRDLVDGLAGGVRNGHILKAVFPGVSNGVLTPDHLDVALDFDSLRAIGSGLGSGGFIVYDDTACIVRTAALFSRFLHVESCGQCPPCKYSSGEITEHLNRLAEGKGTRADIETILGRCATVDQGNRCALPVGEHLLIESLVSRFSDEFHSHCQSPCTLTRELSLPKLTDFDIETHTFTYDGHQQFKQPDWSYLRPTSFT